jgi:DNA-binding response OmpR family regulator
VDKETKIIPSEIEVKEVVSMAQKILIVDDDVDFAKLLGARLMANGYDVVSAYDALRAPILAQQERPHLVILDIRLPGGSGFRVYEILKLSILTSHIPILFVTGFDRVDEQKVRSSLQVLSNPFLVKPFTTEELLEKVKISLEDRSGLTEGAKRLPLVKKLIKYLESDAD